MKINKILALILALCVMVAFCSGCSDEENGISEPPTGEEELYQGETYVLKATVNSVTDILEVEVIESDYAFGVYWVLISENTRYENSSGATIGLSDIHPGDTIEITYGGQVMMSYPPQIVAQKVTLL